MGELTVTGLTAGYGDITAVWDLDLTVRAGQIVALLGRNGAGKTTTLHAIAGLLPASRGTVTLGDVDITRAPPYRRVSAGIALVQEGKQIFRHLTVEENLYLGAYARRIRRRHMHRHLDEQYDRFPILAERRKARAGSLSGGQQQMLAIAQAVLAEPSVLMLDEPSAGLAPAVVIEVFDVVSRLREQGIGVLLVEQLADRALAIADDVIVLDIGRVILRHDTAQGRDPAVLEAAYFGRQ
jgi:branched-chain amino acid transport system ATP-binding protein